MAEQADAWAGNGLKNVWGDVPPEVGESFGRVALAGFKKFIAQPGNREKLEAQTAARKARKERECKE